MTGWYCKKCGVWNGLRNCCRKCGTPKRHSNGCGCFTEIGTRVTFRARRKCEIHGRQPWETQKATRSVRSEVAADYDQREGT